MKIPIFISIYSGIFINEKVKNIINVWMSLL